MKLSLLFPKRPHRITVRGVLLGVLLLSLPALDAPALGAVSPMAARLPASLSAPATLTLSSASPRSGDEGGDGGGAPSIWFLAALPLLCLIRRRSRGASPAG